MTTSSRSIPTFILLKYFSHTQRLSLMSAFCYRAFLNKLSKQRHKLLSVSVTDSPSHAMAYLGFITVPNDS